MFVTFFFRNLNFVFQAGSLCAQLFLQFYSLTFKLTDVLAMSWRCACDLDIILRLILSLFSQFQLSRFSGILTMEVNGLCVP